jgi:hypothetical protein
MEWNSARLKIPVLAGETGNAAATEKKSAAVAAAPSLADLSFGTLCKIGLAFTWPLLLVALGALGVFIALLARK